MQEDKGTIIGDSIFVTGALSGDEDLTVLGRVEGTISLSQTLYVAEGGIVKADIAAENAVISGIVVGNVTANNSVQVTETGRLLGDMRAPRVIVMAGARVRGQIDMSGQEGRSMGQARPTAREAAEEASKVARGTHGRFQRLGLPARRPLPQAPSVARAPQGAEAHAAAAATQTQQAQPQTQEAGQQSARHGRQHAGHGVNAGHMGHTVQAGQEGRPQATAQEQEVKAHAPRRGMSNHSKKRAAARRRD